MNVYFLCFPCTLVVLDNNFKQERFNSKINTFSSNTVNFITQCQVLSFTHYLLYMVINVLSDCTLRFLNKIKLNRFVDDWQQYTLLAVPATSFSWN